MYKPLYNIIKLFILFRKIEKSEFSKEKNDKLDYEPLVIIIIIVQCLLNLYIISVLWNVMIAVEIIILFVYYIQNKFGQMGK